LAVVGLDFPSVRANLAEWEGRRVSVAVDRERIKTGFKPMVALQGALGGVEAVPEVGQEPDIQNIANKDLPPERRTHALFYPVGGGSADDLHGRPGFYLSLPEFDHAAVDSAGLLTITGRDLEIQVQLLDGQ
jgi:hypothetical protein